MNLRILLLLTLLFFDIAMLYDLSKLRSELTLQVLDIGQGDALLISTSKQNHILIDGGPGNKILSELSAVMPPSFREIDLLILTHPHLDHMEGLISVLQRFDVKAVLMSAPSYDSLVYKAFLDAVYDEGSAIYFAQANTDFRLGEVEMDVLYPFENMTDIPIENINNASPVIKISNWLLLTGDAEQEVESNILESGIDIDVDVLKAGHHGSRSSSTLEFLEAVSPRVMLISAGKENPFGHPHPETLDKAKNLGIQVLRTDLDGRITIHPSDLGT